METTVIAVVGVSSTSAAAAGAAVAAAAAYKYQCRHRLKHHVLSIIVIDIARVSSHEIADLTMIESVTLIYVCHRSVCLYGMIATNCVEAIILSKTLPTRIVRHALSYSSYSMTVQTSVCLEISDCLSTPFGKRESLKNTE